MKQPAVYIMTNKRNDTLYTGVTSNLPKRVYEHRTGALKGFTSRYSCTMLVYFKFYNHMNEAITREKLIKGGSRQKEMKLIEEMNPEWRDLFAQVCW